MNFRATFVFGPLSGPHHDRTMVARRVPQRLWFAPVDVGSIPGDTHDGWALVGTDQAPPGRWKGMQQYVLDEELSARRPGQLRGDVDGWEPDLEHPAIYKWVFDAAWVELPDEAPG